jgi:hypothetical protein
MQKEEFKKRIFSIINHINRVRQNSDILINRLIDFDQQDLALRLAAAVSVHDASKFTFIEFAGMYSENENIKKAAVQHHRETNRHHISYHSSYKEMSECDIAEMIIDMKSRSDEFGQNLTEFFRKFAKDHKIPPQSQFYKKANNFIDLVLNQPLKEIKEIEIKEI